MACLPFDGFGHIIARMKQLLATLSGVLIAATALLADELQPNESFQICNVQFGNLLRPLDASNRDGTPIVLYPAAPWKCMTWKCVPQGENYSLQNRFTSKTLAASGSNDGQPNFLVQTPWAKIYADRPAWKFTKLEDGNYKILDPKTGQVLTSLKDDQHGVRVALEEWADKRGQRWEIRKAPARLTM